jgi:dual specificity phosphatase 12
MQDANITHVLSVLRFEIEEVFLKDYKHRHLQIEVDDVEDENLLEHFKTTNAFIEEGLSAGGGVFVHWQVLCPSALREA